MVTERAWVQTPAEGTIFHAPFIWINSWKRIKSPGTVACAVILKMGGWTLWMVYIYICTKALNALWVGSWPRPTKSNGRGENHLGRRVPSSQTSLYRSLWGEYHVHRPLFTGGPSGLGIQGTPLAAHLSPSLSPLAALFYLPFTDFWWKFSSTHIQCKVMF